MTAKHSSGAQLTGVGRLVARINRLVELVVIFAYMGLVVDIATAVFFRYVLNNSLVWAEELARYIFVWLTFLGGGLAVGRNIHIGVDSLVEALPLKTRQVVQLCVELAVSVFVVALIIVGIQLALATSQMQTLLLNVSVAYVYLAVPVGGTVMLLNLLVNVEMRLRALIDGGSI